MHIFDPSTQKPEADRALVYRVNSRISGIQKERDSVIKKKRGGKVETVAQ